MWCDPPSETDDGDDELPGAQCGPFEWLLDEQEETEEGDNRLGSLDIVLLLMDWMHTYKTTDTSTAHLWKIIKLLVPHDVDIRTFNTIKTILRKHEESVVEVIYIFV